MKGINVIGVDLAKNAFHVHGVNCKGSVLLKKKLTRKKFKEFIHHMPAGILVGMEACSGAHYWGRELVKLGYRVKLIAPQFVRPYVKSNKNDFNDAEAICEAVTRPNMRFVSIKQQWHQDLQCLLRSRERLVRVRTSLVNETRAFLAENGTIISRGIRTFRKDLPKLLEQPQYSSLLRSLLQRAYDEMCELDKQIAGLEKQIVGFSNTIDECKALKKISGVGPMSAVGLYISLGDPMNFKNGRQFAASIGLVPRQHSTGGNSRLLGISKRGNVQLRSLLVHGARAVIRHSINKSDPLSEWVKSKAETRGSNKAAVALANKNARFAWAILMGREPRKTA